MIDHKEIIKLVSPLVYECNILKTSDIVFRDTVRDACKRNFCGFYGKSWSCPPAVGDLEELKNKCLKFNWALVFSSCGELKDSFDFEGMMKQRDIHDDLQSKVKGMFSKEKILLLGAGACRICKECNYPRKCRFPDKMTPSVESYGIDVVTLAKKAEINYGNGNNTVTYFSVLLFN